MGRPPRPERSGSRTPAASPSPTRTVDKSRTRRALLDGALALLADRSIDNLAIREVTRSAGVAPAAFYRHFASIDDLGLILVDEAMATLRQLMRDARSDVTAAEDLIQRSVEVLVDHIKAHAGHYRFIVREHFSAVRSVRMAIRQDLRLFATELATDLARQPAVNTWPTADLIMLAEMVVGLMVDTARRLLDVLDDAPDREAELVHDTERRLRYLSQGALSWRPRP
ncbi:MAG: TetR family transcriptional regulator [Aquihabitans sp.]